ncbi:YggS family pyridoxal phosphate-dependent enzyme [Gemella morbillorum]|uniref:Pyridoxal phosphate homeostasis protein n=1 Tax=Gemella morbillorum TaxID=29391 RepID=A0AAP9KSY6_9BACL|nr:YggS family pyridoxal phosphate-dependent enzyme [Gemella morbillorum]EFV35368.1 alanine racemase domain-containing protein [Gemella morbillorum M424]QGS08893.1 YggS family pyridoxal phosphate-dependent enzyme [Gemella morbillorum]
MNVKNNLEKINNDIKNICQKSGRNFEDITLIAVTKYVGDERVKEAQEAGVHDFAENRAVNYIERKEKFLEATWHLIGSLQTRKVRDAINKVDYFHALDRESLAVEIEKRAEHVINCFVQVNTSGEESKHGLIPEAVLEFVKGLEKYPKIRVVGLMTMAPFLEDEATLRSCFRKLRELRDEIKGLCLEYAPCKFLSMGMSNDYEIAIEEGATHIRIGTALVGNELK